MTAWWILIGLSLGRAAFAAHPLQTEDTGTQGVGNVEIENGLTRSKASGSQTLVFQPQFSYGLRPTFDLIAQPSWIHRQAGDHQAEVDGLGDTGVDAKWRFFGQAPWSIGLRAGVGLATAKRGLGLAHGTLSTHELLVVTVDAAPFTVHGNLGLTQNPDGPDQQRQLTQVSAALMWAASARLALSFETDAGSSLEPHDHAWPASSLAGLIWTIVPGLDADLGYQSDWQAPVTRQWLAGLTYRFAP